MATLDMPNDDSDNVVNRHWVGNREKEGLARARPAKLELGIEAES